LQKQEQIQYDTKEQIQSDLVAEPSLALSSGSSAQGKNGFQIFFLKIMDFRSLNHVPGYESYGYE